MTTKNEQRNAGFEQSLALEKGQGHDPGWNPIEEYSRGSIKPEEWLPRSYFDRREIAMRCLDLSQYNRCKFGFTNIQSINWHCDHMKMALDGARTQVITDMVTGMNYGRPRDHEPRMQDSRFAQMAGPNP